MNIKKKYFKFWDENSTFDSFSIFYYTETRHASMLAREERSEVRCKEIKKQYKYNFYIPTHYYITYINLPLLLIPLLNLSKLTCALLPKSIPFLVVAVCTY